MKHGRVLPINRFTDRAGILNPMFRKAIMGYRCYNLPPEHPKIATGNNRTQNGRRIVKKVYWTKIL